MILPAGRLSTGASSASGRIWTGTITPAATACYYALCTLIDDQIGRVLAALEELGQLDNTLIVFASDHGDYHGRTPVDAEGRAGLRGGLPCAADRRRSWCRNGKHD